MPVALAKEDAERVESYVLAALGWPSAVQQPMHRRLANSHTSQPAVESATDLSLCKCISVEHESDIEPPENPGRFSLF